MRVANSLAAGAGEAAGLVGVAAAPGALVGAGAFFCHLMSPLLFLNGPKTRCS
ncbi:MAG: hypothetical protein HYU86_03910 [Chloroflexi bacterium]|nr:hypothetical protein [Chloroflexota bacterium]